MPAIFATQQSRIVAEKNSPANRERCRACPLLVQTRHMSPPSPGPLPPSRGKGSYNRAISSIFLVYFGNAMPNLPAIIQFEAPPSSWGRGLGRGVGLSNVQLRISPTDYAVIRDSPCGRIVLYVSGRHKMPPLSNMPTSAYMYSSLSAFHSSASASIMSSAEVPICNPSRMTSLTVAAQGPHHRVKRGSSLVSMPCAVISS